MKKVLIIGVGGIGSYLTREIHRLVMNDQISIYDVEFTVVDDDEVELKNIKYQNFDKEDIFKMKAEVIREKYCLVSKTKRINTPEELAGFELIILSVDNSATRKMTYDYCYENNIDFIDLRAEGRAFAFFTNEMDKEELVKTLGDNISKEGTSCQRDWDLKNNIIQNGNVIIASYGSQLVLNWLRGEKNPKQMIMRV